VGPTGRKGLRLPLQALALPPMILCVLEFLRVLELGLGMGERGGQGGCHASCCHGRHDLRGVLCGSVCVYICGCVSIYVHECACKSVCVFLCANKHKGMYCACMGWKCTLMCLW